MLCHILFSHNDFKIIVVIEFEFWKIIINLWSNFNRVFKQYNFLKSGLKVAILITILYFKFKF